MPKIYICLPFNKLHEITWLQNDCIERGQEMERESRHMRRGGRARAGHVRGACRRSSTFASSLYVHAPTYVRTFPYFPVPGGLLLHGVWYSLKRCVTHDG